MMSRLPIIRPINIIKPICKSSVSVDFIHTAKINESGKRNGQYLSLCRRPCRFPIKPANTLVMGFWPDDGTFDPGALPPMPPLCHMMARKRRLKSILLISYMMKYIPQATDRLIHLVQQVFLSPRSTPSSQKTSPLQSPST